MSNLDSFKQNLARFFLLAAASFLLFACTDSGCIDADDFGEYESQTITVSANSSQDNCAYNPALSLTDPGQGSSDNFRRCLTQNQTTTYNGQTDSNGNLMSITSQHGCSDISDLSFQTICINNCVQTCLSAVGDTNAAGPAPSWNSTSKKGSGQTSGVTIRPGSQIMVRAVGNISLGGSIDLGDIFVNAANYLPNSNNVSGRANVVEARAGQAMMLNFSGLVSTGSGSSNPPLGENGVNTNLYNLSRRLVLFAIPHPKGYGGFNSNVTPFSEENGSKSVPLLPDPRAWRCNYSGTDILQSACANGSYRAIGYANVDDSMASEAFPISSSVKSSNLTKDGGVIRWDNDGLKGDNYDPFALAQVNCDNNANCSNINMVSRSEGMILGDISSSSIEIKNPFGDAYAVSFKSLNNGCATVPLQVSVQDADGNESYNFNPTTVTTGAWTNNRINLEVGHKFVVSQNTATNGGAVNCGRFIAIRFLKYQDLVMDQSGFVRFSALGPNPSGANCVISGRIINPNGSHGDDFYEYDDISSAATDPMSSVTVPVSTNGSPSWSPADSSSTPQIFVRKGQKIRFYPSSWNNSWSPSMGLSRQCGIGMVMKIDPRPALLCRGVASEMVASPTCVQDRDPTTGALRGCQPVSTDTSCNNCPTSAAVCMDTIDCSAAVGSAPAYSRTCAVTAYNSANCDSALQGMSNSSSIRSSCRTCSDLRVAAGNQAAMVSQSSVNQCYDLENYTGKVANIPAPSPTLSSTDVTTFLASTSAKGAIKLSGFSGTYGNVGDFTDKNLGVDSAQKRKYSVSAQLIPSADSRIRAFILDADGNGTFGGTPYSDNSSIGGNAGGYTGSNAIRVGFSGSLDFRNGQWMQVKLCQESSNGSPPSYDCKPFADRDPPEFSTANSQPQIINIDASAVGANGTNPDLTQTNSAYQFDSGGNLVRFANGGLPGDCTLAAGQYENSPGSTFYCHTYRYFSTQALKAKGPSELNSINNDIQRLRLTFRIFDPEVGNCDLVTAGDSKGIEVANPYYDNSSSGVCGIGEIPGSSGCRKQYYCANKYSNNSGEYYVNVKVKTPDVSSLSSVITAVVNPVIEVMDGKRDNPLTTEDESSVGEAERVYKLLISDSRYQAILKVSLVIMFTFYGVGYLLGVSELNHAEVFGRIIKIAFIYLMVGSTGWDFFKMFFVKFFKEGTDYLSFMMASSFDESPDITNAIDSGNLYDKSVLFRSVDSVFNLFFSSAVQKKVSALLFASIFGWAYLLIIWWSFLNYVYAVANAVLLYLTSQVFISIMFVLGPIFFIFLLFNQTKGMFDKWLTQLIGFSLQQIFLLITLAFFNMLMYEVIKMALGFKVCWDEVWVMNLGITRVSLLSFWTIASLPPRTNVNSQVGNIGNPEGIPSIFSILFIWVIASLMEQFIGFMTDLAAGISGGLKASSMGAGIKSTVEGIHKDYVQPAMDKAWEGTAGRVLDKIDDKLFDSGATADKRRKDEKAEISSNLANKNSMAEAGSAAVSKYYAAMQKDENWHKMSAQDQEKQLSNVRNQAMVDKGKDLGLKDSKVQELLSDKGIKTKGTETVFGAAYQAFKNRGTMNKSLLEKPINASLSSQDAKNLMADMTPKQRQEFIKSQAEGKVNIARNNIETAGDILSGKTRLSDLASAAKSSVKKKAGAVANTLASSALSTLTGADINAAQVLGESSGMDKDFTEARQELIKEGALADNSFGSMVMSKEEKDTVRKRAAENKATREASLPHKKKSTDGREASIALLRHADDLDAHEAIDDREDIGDMNKSARKMAHRIYSAAQSVNPLSESRKKYKGKNKDTDAMDLGIDEAMESNNKDISNMKVERGKAVGAYKKADKNVKAKQQNIAALKTRSNELSAAGKQDEAKEALFQARSEERELRGSEDYKNRDAAKSSIQKFDRQIAIKEKANKIMGEAKAIKNEALIDHKLTSRSPQHQALAVNHPELMARIGQIDDRIEDGKSKLSANEIKDLYSNRDKAMDAGDTQSLQSYVDKYGNTTDGIFRDYANLSGQDSFEQFVNKNKK